jgi:hypothetical protein
MYSWQHCGTGTLSYRQPHHLVIMDQWNGEQRAVAIKMFYIFRFFKSSLFFGSPCTYTYILFEKPGIITSVQTLEFVYVTGLKFEIIRD